MLDFEETPQVVFEVKDAGGNIVYRDAITYETMAELRADSKAERETKFQARYDAYIIARDAPTSSPALEE
jgi:hypothetical protein